jgi:hypothetical protein
MAFGFDGVPDFLDFAVGADQKTAANDSFEQTAHEFLAAPRAVGLDHFMRGVAEQREIQFVLVTEVLQGLYRVGAGSENGDTELVELLFRVTKLGRFDRSTGSIGFRKEEEQDTTAFEILKRELLAAVGGEGEFGSFVADFEHELVLLNLLLNGARFGPFVMLRARSGRYKSYDSRRRTMSLTTWGLAWPLVAFIT